jgi:RNA polymerase sigma-70 factor (ECF subfamily)
MLAEDVVMYGDGGGRGPSLPQPVNGRSKVFRLVEAFADAVATMHLQLEAVAVNGQPGVLARTVDGRLLNVLTVDIYDGRIQTVRSVINADKLQHLGPLLDAVETKGGTTRRRSRG